MPACFLLCLQIARFPLCLCLALQKLRWAHIKLRHFHSEHEFSIIIKTEKAHRLTMFGDARFGAYMWITPTSCVRAANYYFQTHTAFFPHHIEFAFFRVCVCVFCDVNTENYAYGRRKQPFDRTHILTKVNGKRASSLCLLVLNFCFQNETDTQKTTFPLMELNFFFLGMATLNTVISHPAGIGRYLKLGRNKSVLVSHFELLNVHGTT